MASPGGRTWWGRETAPGSVGRPDARGNGAAGHVRSPRPASPHAHAATLIGVDVAGPFQFTHTASHQAWYASVNALFGFLVAWVLVRYSFPGRRLVDALVPADQQSFSVETVSEDQERVRSWSRLWRRRVKRG